MKDFLIWSFQALHNQKGETPSRKDEIISLLYLLAYFQKGQLPWSKFMKEKMT